MKKETTLGLRMAGVLWPILDGKIQLDALTLSAEHEPEGSSILILGWPETGQTQAILLTEPQPWLYEQPADLIQNDQEVVSGMATWQSSTAGQTTVVWRSRAAAHWQRLQKLTLGQLLGEVYLPFTGQPAGTSSTHDILYYNSHADELLVFAPPLRATGLINARHDVLNLALVEPEQLIPQFRLQPLLELLADHGIELALKPDQQHALKNYVFCAQGSNQHKALDWSTLGLAELSFSSSTYALNAALRTVTWAEPFMPSEWPKPVYRCCVDKEHNCTLAATVTNTGSSVLYVTTVLYLANASGTEVLTHEQSYEIPSGQSLTVNHAFTCEAAQGCILGMRAILSHNHANWTGSWVVQPSEEGWSGISLGRLLADITVADFMRSLCQATGMKWQFTPATLDAAMADSNAFGSWYAQPSTAESTPPTVSDPGLEAAHKMFFRYKANQVVPNDKQEALAAYVAVNTITGSSKHTVMLPMVSAQTAWLEGVGWLAGGTSPELISTAAGLIPFVKLDHLTESGRRESSSYAVELVAELPLPMALPYLDMQWLPYAGRLHEVVHATFTLDALLPDSRGKLKLHLMPV